MHGRMKADGREIFDGDVSGESRAVHEQSVIADVAIVPDVRRRQKEISVADGRFSAAADGAAADGDILAKRVPVTDLEFGLFTLKPEILRVAADRAKGVKNIIAANFRGSLHHRVRMQHATLAELDVFANHRISAHANACAEFRAGRDNRLFVNLRRTHFLGSSALGAAARSTILHISVASAASCPSTVARPSNLQKSPRQEITFISTFNWSPGTTGRRKRAPSTATKYKSLRSRSGTSCNRSKPPVCAIDSMISTPGIIGWPGKCPWKCDSLMVTFFTPTMRFRRSISRMASTIRKG